VEAERRPFNAEPPSASVKAQLFRYSDKIAETVGFHAETRIGFAETLPSNNGFSFWPLSAKPEPLQARRMTFRNIEEPAARRMIFWLARMKICRSPVLQAIQQIVAT